MVSMRTEWTKEILDFLCWRSRAIFTDWNPTTAPALASILAKREWEWILVSNIVLAPQFGTDLNYAAIHSSREVERARLPPIPRVVHGRLRGRPLYRPTVKERIRRADPTVWVIDPRIRAFQTEPNSAIVGFLTHLRRVVLSAPWLFERLDRRVADVVGSIGDLLDRWPLRDVIGDPEWFKIDIPQSIRAKVPFYGRLWRWAAALRDSRRSRDASIMRQALMQGWLAEEDEDRLFELFGLSRVISIMHGSAPWSRFVKLENRLEFEASLMGISSKVLVDKTPAVHGAYHWLLARYDGIDGSGLRPDLQIVTKFAEGVRTTFVEMKNTSPQSRYGRESVVKALGYLKDYAKLWSGDDEVMYPRAVVVFSGEISPRVPLLSRLDDEVMLASPSTLDDDVKGIVERHLQSLLQQDLNG